MKYLAVVLLALAIIGGNEALKCFECTDCDGKTGNPQECDEDKNVCQKIVVGDHEVKRCGEEELCGLGKLERAANKVFSKVVNVFKDVDKEASLMYCCDDDLCNGSFRNIPSVAVILLPLLLMAVLKF